MSVSDPIVSKTGLVLADAWSAAATIELSGQLEKLDVAPYSGDALVQFRVVDTGEWTPSDGVGLTSRLFQSLTGLGDLFAGHGYVNAVRFRRRVAGVATTIDVRCYLT
jgi:hypothetical protein